MQMQPVSCMQHREQHISRWNYEISVVQEIHISRLELQRWSLKFVISFSKVLYIFGIWDWLMPFEVMWSKSRLHRWFFSLCFPNYEKLKCFVETFTSYNQILIFEEQLQYVCPIWLFIFDTDQAQAEEHFFQKLNLNVVSLIFGKQTIFCVSIILFQIF